MRKRIAPLSKGTDVLFAGICLFAAVCCTATAYAAQAQPNVKIETGTAFELLKYEDQSSSVRIEPARLDNQFGIAVIFEGTGDLHYYAKSETAPAPDFNLKVTAESEYFNFGRTIYPKWEIFTDSLKNKVEVYAGNFTVFIPINSAKASTGETETQAGDINVTIKAMACTSKACLNPFEKTFQTNIDWSQRRSWAQISFEKPAGKDNDQPAPKSSQPILFALALAFLAGLTLNIMPCVWPVLPLIVMRIVGQAKQSRSVSTAMGFAFCLGILLFFAILAGANIVLQVFYGTVLQWGDQFRNPTFVAAMTLLLVLLAMFMFGLFSITVPSAISSRQSTGKGYISAIGMGLLASVLSTPCSFGILAAAFAWAQSQTLFLSTTAIMIIGVGMALPYAVLTSIPKLLNKLPKPGKWMELFKQGIGFVLLIIAVKLVLALPEARTTGVLYFSVILAFCVWMWGTWVDFGTKPLKKWTVRLAAVVLAVLSGWALLPSAKELIDWKPYEAAAIETAIEQQRPVLIKFTADWCLSCQTVQKVVYSRKDIADLIKRKNVLAIKADTTEKEFPATIALENIYNEPGVPVTMLFVPGKEEPYRWRGILFAGELKKQLEELPDKQGNN